MENITSLFERSNPVLFPATATAVFAAPWNTTPIKGFVWTSTLPFTGSDLNRDVHDRTLLDHGPGDISPADHILDRLTYHRGLERCIALLPPSWDNPPAENLIYF